MGTDNSLATELLHELKAQSKRWFIAFCVMVGLEIATIAGFMWYISLPSEDVSFDTEEGNATYIGDNLMGDLNNGKNESDKENNTQP